VNTDVKKFMKIHIGSDHGGYELKEKIKKHFSNIEWMDHGCFNEESVDYPDIASNLCHSLSSEIKQNPMEKPMPLSKSLGILICGSGQGMAMKANKFIGIRAALVWNEESTKLSREHNDANVLCLGGRLISTDLAIRCVEIFLTTSFAGGRHERRIQKI
jgi:ribose 5-phosphate isomerase B